LFVESASIKIKLAVTVTIIQKREGKANT